MFADWWLLGNTTAPRRPQIFRRSRRSESSLPEWGLQGSPIHLACVESKLQTAVHQGKNGITPSQSNTTRVFHEDRSNTPGAARFNDCGTTIVTIRSGSHRACSSMGAVRPGRDGRGRQHECLLFRHRRRSAGNGSNIVERPLTDPASAYSRP